MSELTLCSWPLPTAELGPPSPLAPVRRRPRPAVDTSGQDIPAHMAQAMAYGHADSLLPYAMQDAYTRTLKTQDHPAAVLENRYLRAVFLLDCGGRMWSLLHKPSQTELLAQSPSITFCNLGLRNAWFRGGVEWNFGAAGHSPLTCSPLHAARLLDGHGNPILRLYEWERLRQVIVQIDVYLPDDSPVLLVRPRILNPGSRTVPMYWWSNLAVPLTHDMRVLVPAESMYVLGGRDELRHSSVPLSSGVDITFPENWTHAADLFFDLLEGQLPWIAAVSRDGAGIFHASQEKMPGRKLWVWGNSTAGRNWQEFLAPGAGEYVEIQAGLTRTQLEHWPLAAGESRAWMEAYGYLSVDPAFALGTRWVPAWRHAAERIGECVTPTTLAEADRLLGGLADTPPDSILQQGEGWGALERHRCEAQGAHGFGTPGVAFDDQSLGEDQAAWITLLESGAFPEAQPNLPPRAFLVGEEWESLLRSALPPRRDGSWNAWLHLGVMRHSAGDEVGAEAAWRRSLEACWNPWAARNLAILHWERGELDDAVPLMLDARHAAPAQLDLLVECGSLLIEARKPKEWEGLLADLTPAQRAHGRVRLLEAQAAILAGDPSCAERFFADRIVPDDLRQGETSLADLWSALQGRRRKCQEASRPDGNATGANAMLPAIPAEMDYVIR